jgi:hypothetical protein
MLDLRPHALMQPYVVAMLVLASLPKVMLNHTTQQAVTVLLVWGAMSIVLTQRPPPIPRAIVTRSAQLRTRSRPRA